MTLQVVADILRRRQTLGWLVGGSVRDRELGCLSPDLDIVVLGDAAAAARELARQLKAPWFVLSERHPAYRIMGPDGCIDVAPVKGGDIFADLAERDFTVNAMAVPLGGTDIIDPFGGLEHIRQRRLVTVSDRVFRDDPLRMMRAAHFHHVLGLEIDAGLAAAVRGQAPLLAATARRCSNALHRAEAGDARPGTLGGRGSARGPQAETIGRHGVAGIDGRETRRGRRRIATIAARACCRALPLGNGSLGARGYPR